MNYINANFTSLLDLDDLDTKIARLSEVKQELSQTIVAKSSGAHYDTPTAIPTQILDFIQDIEGLSPASSLDRIDSLIKKYGSVAILTKIRSLLESRKSLMSEHAEIEASVAVESQINQLSNVPNTEEVQRISIEIGQMKASAPMCDILHTSLRQVINSKRASLSATLSSRLAEIKWLSSKEKVTINADKFKDISTIFNELVQLQTCDAVPNYPDVWWGLETLLAPFTLRFNFHFRDSPETNKLSKPEWALTYAEEFLNDNLLTLEFIIGDTFFDHEKIGVYEIISAVLVPVREKLKIMLDMINQKISESHDDEKATDQFGRLISHLIFEVTSFDQRMRNKYKYNPFIKKLDSVPEKKWMGLTGDILLSKEKEKESLSVVNWLNLELRLAKVRFNTEIISPDNAFEIDDEFTANLDSPESIVKPTYSAYGLSKLFDNLTSHFRTINIVKYQLRFVSHIQLAFLDQYLEELEKQLRQFNDSLRLKLISSFMKTTVKNEANPTTQTVVTNGLTGLKMLTGIFCLTKFVIGKMEEWAESLIYIQLWDYCQSKSGDSGDSIFDAPIKEYKKLLTRVLSKYEEFFKKEIRGALKDYVNNSSWDDEDSHSTSQISTSLSGITATIPAYTSYLRRSLLEIDYAMISSSLCDSFAYILLEYVITNNQFTRRGLNQLHTDINFMESTLKDHLLLDQLHRYSNAENKNYKKVRQSIEMMSRFDATGAKLLKKQFLNSETIRSQFDSRLDSLSDGECLDLLFRII